MADMEVSSDTGHNRPEDEEDLIEIDFDLPEEPSIHASNLNPNDDSDMADDYGGEAIDDADPPEPTEHTMEEANPLDDQIVDDDYAIDENDEQSQEGRIADDGEVQDLDLLDPDADQDYEEHEQTTLAPTNENNSILASDTDLARVIAHPIYVVYEGEKYPLLPSNTDEESQYSVLQSDTQVKSSLEDLFSACKDMLQEQADRLTLVLEFTSIGLTIDECSIYKTACSLYSILDVYIGLCENDAVSSGESEKTPLYIELYTQSSFWSRFEQLRDGRQAGRGLTQYAYQADEDDASDGHALEEANGNTIQASQDQDETYDAVTKEGSDGAENGSQAGTHGPEGEVQETLYDSKSGQAQYVTDTNVAGEHHPEEETELGHDDNGDAGEEAVEAYVDHQDEAGPPEGDEDEYYPEEQENYDPANDEEQYEPNEPDGAAQNDPPATHLEQDQKGQENEQEEEEEEEDLIDYSDEEHDVTAENNVDNDPEEPEDHSRDELNGDSTSFPDAHESHETLDGDASPHEDDVQGDGDNQVAHSNATGNENAEEYFVEREAVNNDDEADPKAEDVESQLHREQTDKTKHDHFADGNDGEDEIGFDLEDEIDDEADSEQTIGRTHDDEQHSAAEPVQADEVQSEPTVDATHDQLTTDIDANKASNVSHDGDEDDSWLTGYDEAYEELGSSDVKTATRSKVDLQDVDETSSIDSFSGETPSSAGRTQDTTLTSYPTPGTGTGTGTLLHIPAKGISRKRSRSDLSDILDLDFESNVEAKKAKAA